jgi:Vacuolar protein sorting-associated protein
MQHVLQYLLPSILGDFIQGIDKKRIRTNFFTGKISLKEVSLNPDLVAHLGYPIRHVYSFIGNLEVRIPWVKKLKEPIEIVLDDLFLLVEPTEKMDDFDIIEERIKFLNKLTKECITKLKNLEKEKYKRGEPAPYYRILILDNFRVINLNFP